VHLGLKTGPLCPIFHTKLEEPCSFSKVPDGLYSQFSNILRFQKYGAQICISEWSQGLKLTQNVDWGFLLSTTFPKILMSSGSKKGTRYVYRSPNLYIWVKPRPQTHTKCGLQFPPQYHISYNLNVLWVEKKEPGYATHFPQGDLASESPPGSPTEPLCREIPTYRAFHLSLNMSLFIFPSESPVRKPPPCSLTGSPWVAILHHQSHWSTLHSFMYVCRSPQKRALLLTFGEKHKVTNHTAPRRRKAYIEWGAAWFPRLWSSYLHNNVIAEARCSIPLAPKPITGCNPELYEFSSHSHKLFPEDAS
jgi:hypothetical protein